MVSAYCIIIQNTFFFNYLPLFGLCFFTNVISFSMGDLVKIQITLFEFVLKTPSMFNVKMESPFNSDTFFLFHWCLLRKKNGIYFAKKIKCTEIKASLNCVKEMKYTS